jgi:hypothetical protein
MFGENTNWGEENNRVMFGENTNWGEEKLEEIIEF